MKVKKNYTFDQKVAELKTLTERTKAELRLVTIQMGKDKIYIDKVNNLRPHIRALLNHLWGEENVIFTSRELKRKAS